MHNYFVRTELARYGNNIHVIRMPWATAITLRNVYYRLMNYLLNDQQQNKAASRSEMGIVLAYYC